MKTFNTVTSKHHGLDVAVDTFDMGAPDGIPVYKVSATSGQTTVHLRGTLGPDDGTLGAPSLTHVQDRIDELRVRAARAAASKELLRLQFESAK